MRDAWLARLPAEKDAVFAGAVARLESSYGMLSVALDEALDLRERCELLRARQEAGVCGHLFGHLVEELLVTLAGFESHTRHFGTLPAVAPLDPENFRGQAARLASAWSTLLHHVLLGTRNRWFHKLRTLTEILTDLGLEFRETSAEIADGTCIEPVRGWEALDSLHFDLNTCLRETIVILKCFLRALPAEELPGFRQAIEPWPEKKTAASPLLRAAR